jgi:ribonuclease P protein component
VFTGHFARHQRLLRPAEFKQVFARPCKYSDKHLTLLCRQNDLPHARLGLAIAKKQVKTAVARNRIKRMCRETFRENQNALAGLDIVVLARTSAAQLTTQELRRVLEKLWQGLMEKCKS